MNEKLRMKRLTDEVLAGLFVKDTLPNAANDFSGEVQANYFSNARKNMDTDFFHIIVFDNQQLIDKF